MTVKRYVLRLLKHMLIKAAPVVAWDIMTVKENSTSNSIYQQFGRYWLWLTNLDKLLKPGYSKLSAYNRYVNFELLPISNGAIAPFNRICTITLPRFANLLASTGAQLKTVQWNYEIKHEVLEMFSVQQNYLCSVALSDTITFNSHGLPQLGEEIPIKKLYQTIKDNKPAANAIVFKLLILWVLLLNRLYTQINLTGSLSMNEEVVRLETVKKELTAHITKIELKSNCIKTHLQNLLTIWLWFMLAHSREVQLGSVRTTDGHK